MSTFLQPFEYELKAPFEYANDGDFVTAKTITVKGPTCKIKDLTSKLAIEWENSSRLALIKVKETFGEKRYEKMMDSSQDGKKETEEKVAKPEEVVNTLVQAGTLTDFLVIIESILVGGSNSHPNCTIDGTTRITRTIMEDMAPYDLNMILGEYIINFITASHPS